METVRLVFDQLIVLMTQFFNFLMTDAGIFGTWVVFMVLLRKLAQAFNKLKG